VLILKQNGFDDKKAAAILGGYQGWVSAGFPTESSQQ
jgi:rhodanese-related sulfurtransferase